MLMLHFCSLALSRRDLISIYRFLYIFVLILLYTLWNSSQVNAICFLNQVSRNYYIPKSWRTPFINFLPTFLQTSARTERGHYVYTQALLTDSPRSMIGCSLQNISLYNPDVCVKDLKSSCVVDLFLCMLMFLVM